VGAIVSASRGIQYASGLDVAAAQRATRGFQNQLNNALNLLD
jgi:orotidine-5'-phosphate decarboxylase